MIQANAVKGNKTEMEKYTVKACPYCGDTPKVINSAIEGVYVQCSRCGARTAGVDFENEAIEIWNMRASDCGECVLEVEPGKLDPDSVKYVESIERYKRIKGIISERVKDYEDATDFIADLINAMFDNVCFCFYQDEEEI